MVMGLLERQNITAQHDPRRIQQEQTKSDDGIGNQHDGDDALLPDPMSQAI